jgi:hypothetical protein
MSQGLLQWDVKPLEEGLLLVFRGEITENADFSKVEQLASQLLVVDLDGVTKINSMGIKKWILWVRAHQGKQFHFRNCTPVIVNQMNILQGFLPPGALVESFYLPFRCDDCGLESSYLAERRRDYVEATTDAGREIKIPETRPCEQCGSAQEWDVMEQVYFRFLGR